MKYLITAIFLGCILLLVGLSTRPVVSNFGTNNFGVPEMEWAYHQGFSDGMRLGPLEAERKARVHLKEGK